jgi:hypothetical protein
VLHGELGRFLAAEVAAAEYVAQLVGHQVSGLVLSDARVGTTAVAVPVARGRRDVADGGAQDVGFRDVAVDVTPIGHAVAEGKVVEPVGLAGLPGGAAPVLEYRELFARAPAYRAFLRHVLSSHRLVFVGFSLTDHDFEQILDNLANAYGGPLQEHVWIAKREPHRDADYLRLQELYGVVLLEIADWGDLGATLQTALARVPPRVQDVLERAVAANLDERKLAHREVSALTTVGKRAAARHLRSILAAADLHDRDETHVHEMGEAVYTLRVIGPVGGEDDERTREAVLDLLERADHTELLAHACLVLERFATASVVPRLQAVYDNWGSRVVHRDHHLPDPDDRVPVYLTKLLCEVRAREQRVS